MLNRNHIIKLKQLIYKMGWDIRRANRALDAAIEEGSAHALNHDDILSLYFRSIDPKTFYFLQIGANDGVMQDPLHRYIRRHNLVGCLVEPQPKVFKQLQDNYADLPQLQLKNIAVSHEAGKKKLYTFPENLNVPDHDFNFSGLASFNRDHAVSAFNQHAPRLGINGKAEDYLIEINVKTQSIDDLMTELKQQKIDYLQIDTEGFDFEIIKLIDFQKYQPDIIAYEHFSLSDDDKIACWDYLKQQGYLCAVHGIDTLAYKDMTAS